MTRPTPQVISGIDFLSVTPSTTRLICVGFIGSPSIFQGWGRIDWILKKRNIILTNKNNCII